MNEEENKQVELIRPNQLLNSDGSLTKKRNDDNLVNIKMDYSTDKGICRKGTIFSLFLAVLNAIYFLYLIVVIITRSSSSLILFFISTLFFLLFGIPNLIISIGFAIRTLNNKDAKKKYKVLSKISICLNIPIALLILMYFIGNM